MKPGKRIGIDLGGTKVEAVLLDADGAVLRRERLATPRSYAGTLAAIKGIVAGLDALAGMKAPVGIGTPGKWVAHSRSMRNCNSTWLNGQPLLDDLRASLGDRVRIANDANCFALSEAADGTGRDAEAVFGVILGTGVGGGIVVHGRLLPGANAIAGEWGHVPLPDFRADPATRAVDEKLADRRCYCGQTNCVETFLCGPGLARTHEALTGERTSAAAIAPDAPSVEHYISTLARALALVVNILDPDVVVLGGGVSKLDGLADRVGTRLGGYCFTHEGRTRVVRARHGDSSGVFGAARLWPQSVYNPRQARGKPCYD